MRSSNDLPPLDSGDVNVDWIISLTLGTFYGLMELTSWDAMEHTLIDNTRVCHVPENMTGTGSCDMACHNGGTYHAEYNH